MKKTLFAVIIFGLFLSHAESDAQPGEISGQTTIISGTLFKVSVERREIYIVNDSRMIRFTADQELCDRFKDEINTMVSIEYVKGNDGALYITAMKIIK